MRISIGNILKYVDDDNVHSFVEDLVPHLLPESKAHLLKVIAHHNLYNDSNLQDEDIIRICKVVSGVTGIINILATTSRKQKEVLARHLVMYICYCEFRKAQLMTYKEIGSLFYHHFEHNVVLHSISSMRNRYQIDTLFRRKIMIPIANQIPSVQYDLSNVQILG